MNISKNTELPAGDVLLMVGTTKGSFLISSSSARKKWSVSGPHFPGLETYALAYDDRSGRNRIWAGVMSYPFGSVLCSSDDLGKTWTQPETANIKFPSDTAVALKRIWQISLGRPSEPDTLYCGVDPAALFESRDAGKTWSLVRGLFDHPHRPRWEPGFGGLCLHTILPHPTDPNRIHVAISAAGVYRSDDGGQSWKTSHRGVRADFRPDKYPEFGQCIHKVARHPSKPETMFLQNHGGLYRTDDGGDSWHDIANGVPSDFGFGLAVHPHRPETVYIVPLSSGELRWVPEAKLRVFRSANGGKSWQALTRGLPQKDAYETILRDALATDSQPRAGVYFGTRSGKLFGSSNDGDSWKLLLEGLPPIVCVKAAVLKDSQRPARPRKRLSQKRRRIRA